MEYTQWVDYGKFNECKRLVLILVVMEYTQWAKDNYISVSLSVLILVVMEYTQWVIIT